MINYAYTWTASICSIVFPIIIYFIFFSVIWPHFQYWFKRIGHNSSSKTAWNQKFRIHTLNKFHLKTKSHFMKGTRTDWMFLRLNRISILFFIFMRSMNECNKYGFCHSLASCSCNTYYALLQTTKIHILNSACISTNVFKFFPFHLISSFIFYISKMRLRDEESFIAQCFKYQIYWTERIEEKKNI